MKQLMVLWLCLLANLGVMLAGDQAAATYYLQLVRGSDEDAPPVAGVKAVGPGLSKTFHSVFPWKHYWELKRDSMTLKTGEMGRKRMTPEREVEIALLDESKMEIRLYRNGQRTRVERQSRNTQFFIVGGNKEQNQCWFIVVRRDKPPEPAKD